MRLDRKFYRLANPVPYENDPAALLWNAIFFGAKDFLLHHIPNCF